MLRTVTTLQLYQKIAQIVQLLDFAAEIRTESKAEPPLEVIKQGFLQLQKVPEWFYSPFPGYFLERVKINNPI